MSAWDLVKGMLLKDVIDFAICAGSIIILYVIAWICNRLR